MVAFIRSSIFLAVLALTYNTIVIEVAPAQENEWMLDDYDRYWNNPFSVGKKYIVNKLSKWRKILTACVRGSSTQSDDETTYIPNSLAVTKSCFNWIKDIATLGVNERIKTITPDTHVLIIGYIYQSLLHTSKALGPKEYCFKIYGVFSSVADINMFAIVYDSKTWFKVYGFDLEHTITETIDNRIKTLDVYLPIVVADYIRYNTRRRICPDTFEDYCSIKGLLNLQLESQQDHQIVRAYSLIATLTTYDCKYWIKYSEQQITPKSHYLALTYKYNQIHTQKITGQSKDKKIMDALEDSIHPEVQNNPSHLNINNYCSNIFPNGQDKNIHFNIITDPDIMFDCQTWFKLYGYHSSSTHDVTTLIRNRNTDLDKYLPDVIKYFIRYYDIENMTIDRDYFCKKFDRPFLFRDHIEIENEPPLEVTDDGSKSITVMKQCTDWIQQSKGEDENDYFNMITPNAHYLVVGYYYQKLLLSQHALTSLAFCEAVHPQNENIPFLNIYEVDFVCEKWLEMFGYGLRSELIMVVIQRRNKTLDLYLSYLIRNFINFNELNNGLYSHSQYCEEIGYKDQSIIFIDQEKTKKTCAELITFFGYTDDELINKRVFVGLSSKFKSQTFITLEVAIYNFIMCNTYHRNLTPKDVCNKIYPLRYVNTKLQLTSLHQTFKLCDEWLYVVGLQFNDSSNPSNTVYVNIRDIPIMCYNHIHVFASMWIEVIRKVSTEFSDNKTQYEQYFDIDNFCSLIGVNSNESYQFINKDYNLSCEDWLIIFDYKDNAAVNHEKAKNISDTFFNEFGEFFPSPVFKYIRYLRTTEDNPTAKEFCDEIIVGL